ncbi:hypothetical protein [Mycoplasmopsis glycophila]|uniref:Uncharacterized protein n=1 Tax=Mycoplasmopsis glycophila TaxID=171285 RepID=A0A449AW71_9BACT|nr:hypothetical protein [Mycoplasmopsis glycophila]VEU70894.1 Uncharacterised protein [Mycoplasmopsis glycophila]
MQLKVSESPYLLKYFKYQSIKRFLLSLVFLVFFIGFLGSAIWIVLSKTSLSAKDLSKYYKTYNTLAILFFAAAIAFFSLYLTIQIYDFLYFQKNFKNKKMSWKEKKIPFFVFFSSILSFVFKNKYLYNSLVVHTEEETFKIELYNFEEHFKIISSPRLDYLYNRYIKVSIMDIALSGMLLALFTIITLLTKYTIFKFLTINFEYIFAIVYAFLFRYLKGAILAFVSDALSLIIFGKIAFWYWAYAVVPIFIVIFSSAAFELYKRNKNIMVIMSNITLFTILLLLEFLFYKKISGSKASSFAISEFFGFKRLPNIVGHILFIVFLCVGFVILFLSFYYFSLPSNNSLQKEKKTKISTFIFIFSLVFSIVVISRWIWGPYAWISYSEYIGRIRSKSYATDLDWYFGLMMLIALKSFLALPVYVFLTWALLPALKFAKKRYLDQNIWLKY